MRKFICDICGRDIDLAEGIRTLTVSSQDERPGKASYCYAYDICPLCRDRIFNRRDAGEAIADLFRDKETE